MSEAQAADTSPQNHKKAGPRPQPPKKRVGVEPGPLPEGASRMRRLEEKAARWFANTRLPLLAQQRDEAVAAVNRLPHRLQRLTNQTSLVLELIEDVRTRRYRDVSWVAVAIGTGALLYCISPADAIPDFIPVVGIMDEAIVLAVATRLIRRDLIRYAEFKGYDRSEYFS